MHLFPAEHEYISLFVGCLLLTFEEDEPAVMSFISRIYVSRQTPPKVTDGHGVVIKNPVPAHPPEPSTLTTNKEVCSRGEEFCHCCVVPKSNLNKQFVSIFVALPRY